tara:strand:+ start:6277 stop:6459 length:183 start_codon:yes stop_codon:yes gene_type:complete
MKNEYSRANSSKAVKEKEFVTVGNIRMAESVVLSSIASITLDGDINASMRDTPPKSAKIS